MSTCITIASGNTWHIYEDQLDERVWLEIENIEKNIDLEIAHSIDDHCCLTVEVVLPDDLVDLLRRRSEVLPLPRV